MVRKVRIVVWLGLVLVILGYWAVGMWLRVNRDLIRNSTNVADFSAEWTLSDPESNSDNDPLYAWVSADRLFFCSTGSQAPRGPFIYDIRSHQRTILPHLRRGLGSGDHSVLWWDLSPDANWILWERGNDGDLLACRLDGTKSRHWHVPGFCHFCWLDDSRRWVAIGERSIQGAVDGETVGDVDRPGIAIWRQIAGSERRCLPIDLHTRYPKAVITLRGSVLPHGAPGAAQLLRVVEVSPPGKAEIKAVIGSPDGRRLAWLLRAPPAHGLLDYVHETIPCIPASPREPERAVLCISRADGSGMREIGSVAVTQVDGGVPDAFSRDVPDCVRWLPDGKHLSFVYKYAIWTVSVD